MKVGGLRTVLVELDKRCIKLFYKVGYHCYKEDLYARGKTVCVFSAVLSASG